MGDSVSVGIEPTAFRLTARRTTTVLRNHFFKHNYGFNGFEKEGDDEVMR